MSRVKNPLRKRELEENGRISNMVYYNEYTTYWAEKIKDPELLSDGDDRAIQVKYMDYKNKFPDRANAWVQQLAEKKSADIYLRNKVLSTNEKILEMEGIQVFKDDGVDLDLSRNSKNYQDLEKSLRMLLINTRGILPNKKPRIVVTNPDNNRLFKGLKYAKSASGIYYDKLIYISQDHISDPYLFIHEFAHAIAASLPKNRQKMLDEAYGKMLDIYKRSAKIKGKLVLEPKSMNDAQSVRDAQNLRKEISKRLGFPQYGLMNSSEFFAVLIEHWNTLPNNAATYKYKQLVKQILTAL